MTLGTPVELVLVEDDPYDAELAVRALRRQHATLSLFMTRDGTEALEFLLCAGPYAGRSALPAPKVVLLDLKLPKVDGLEVLRRLRADERTRRLPVVVLTSSREERDVRESYRHGANSYIVKPVDFDQYLVSVSEIGRYWLMYNEPSR